MVLEFGLLKSGLFPFSDASGEGLTAELQEQLRQGDGYGIVPIGGVVAWCKSLAGVPQTLNSAFVECNGQALSDPDSPLNGQTIPNLNNTRFLVGAAASGATGGSSTHSHAIIPSGQLQHAAGNYAAATDSKNHLPPYYAVVWIMRVK